MFKYTIVFLIFIYSSSYSQFDDLLKKTAVPELLEEKNITSSIDDAHPVVFWINNDELPDPIEPENYNSELGPGYYRMTIQSYCLKAGTHGPTKGSGHLIAPLKGKLDDIVENILTKSANHPEIAQKDIQLLLWAIIAGTKFTDLDAALQMRVKPLLTEAEIVRLSVGIEDIPLDLLPDDIKSAARFYKDLRSKITDPSSNFEDIERMAVISGDPPSQFLKKQVDPGNWAYIGDGFYMKLIPERYSKSILELYRPETVNIQKDEKGRITLFEKEGNKIEITFHDEPGSDVMKADDGKYYPIYRFKTIKFTGTNPDEEEIIENEGWMIRGDGKELKNVTEYKNYPQDPSVALYKSRLALANDFFKKISKYKKDSNHPGKGSETDISEEFNAQKHQRDGMNAVRNTTDFVKKSNWIRKHLNYVRDWWNCATNQLSGSSCDNNDNPKKPKVPKKIGMPGNTRAQRIAPSMRKYESDY